MQGLAATLDRPDRLLVDMARNGDKDAFGELMRRHYRRCVDVATSFLHNHWDAEDQVQVAFLKAYTRLHQYHGDAEFATWLLRIVTNECLMFMRDSRRARFVHLDDTSRESESAPFELRECGPNAENALASGEMKQILATEVRRVPPLLRNVIMLRDIQELPMRAAADTLEIRVPAAKSRLLRARVELRLRLRHYGIVSALSRPAAPLSRSTHHRAMNPSGERSASLSSSGLHSDRPK